MQAINPPFYTPWGQKSVHVAYQIKGKGAQNNVQSLTLYTP